MTDPQMGKMLYINPGAAGKAGFHHVQTIVRCQIKSGVVSDMQVVELGKRAQKKEPPL